MAAKIKRDLGSVRSKWNAKRKTALSDYMRSLLEPETAKPVKLTAEQQLRVMLDGLDLSRVVDGKGKLKISKTAVFEKVNEMLRADFGADAGETIISRGAFLRVFDLVVKDWLDSRAEKPADGKIEMAEAEKAEAERKAVEEKERMEKAEAERKAAEEKARKEESAKLVSTVSNMGDAARPVVKIKWTQLSQAAKDTIKKSQVYADAMLKAGNSLSKVLDILEDEHQDLLRQVAGGDQK